MRLRWHPVHGNPHNEIENGEVVMDSRAIARNYIFGYFIPDIAVILCDCVIMLFEYAARVSLLSEQLTLPINVTHENLFLPRCFLVQGLPRCKFFFLCLSAWLSLGTCKVRLFIRGRPLFIFCSFPEHLSFSRAK